MAEFVLDASVAISWCFPGDPTENTAYSRNILLEALACRWDLAAYDASYLALALRKRIPLATSDEFLRRKALDEGIEILHKEITVPKGTTL